MIDFEELEARRLGLQAALDGRKTQAERNRLGQFATPPALARDILAHGLSLLPSGERLRFLDPGIGTGSFFSALLAATPEGRIERAEGFEVDAHYGLPAKQLWKATPLKVHTGDFTTTKPPAVDDRFNLLICNPPYVRHHHLEKAEKVRLQAASESACGVKIAGLAGLYCHFLTLSHAWMAEGGVAGWLVPSEFMDVNYGKSVKQYLLTKVTLLRIHRFDPNDVQFGDALVSSAVVWFRNVPPPAGHEVEFTFGGCLASPKVRRLVAADVLHREPKWTRFPISDVREVDADRPTLKDFFAIKRGLATGDNKFFIMTPEEIAERELPKQFFRPILPSPRYLPDNEIAADEHGNPAIRRKLFLLDCRLPEAEVKAKHPKLWAYLAKGVPDVSERYLCKARKPWYAQENRPASPFICTYLGRSDRNGGEKPFRFILNHSKATVANVYLMLYPKPVLERALVQDPGLARRVWEVLNAIRPEDLLGEGRVYGGGLHKLEPKELANVNANVIAALLPGSAERPVVQRDLFKQRVA